jgi:hypothetical protein
MKILVDNGNPATLRRRANCRSKAGRTSSHHENINLFHHCVRTCIFALHTTWHVRLCATESTSARHSMHTPIPHNTDRGDPVSDRLEGTPAIRRATATVLPSGTRTGAPFTITTTESDMRRLADRARRKIRLLCNRRLPSENHVGDQSPRRH